jgi:hypothetical protein
MGATGIMMAIPFAQLAVGELFCLPDDPTRWYEKTAPTKYIPRRNQTIFLLTLVCPQTPIH